MLRKILSIILAVIMMLSLCACGNEEPKETIPTIPEESIEEQVVESFDDISEYTENVKEPTEPTVVEKTIQKEVEKTITYETWYSSISENTQDAISVFKINGIDYDVASVTTSDLDANELVTETKVVAENVEVNESVNVPKKHSKYEHTVTNAEGVIGKVYSRVDSDFGFIYAIADILIENVSPSIIFYKDLAVGLDLAGVTEKVGSVEIADYYINNVTVKDAAIIKNAQNTLVLLFKEVETVDKIAVVNEEGNPVLNEDGEQVYDEVFGTKNIVNEIVLINNKAYEPETVIEIVEETVTEIVEPDATEQSESIESTEPSENADLVETEPIENESVGDESIDMSDEEFDVDVSINVDGEENNTVIDITDFVAGEENGPDNTGFLATIREFGTIITLISSTIMLFTMIFMWKIFVKMEESGWKSLIPVYSSWILCKHAWDGKGAMMFTWLIPVVGSYFMYATWFKLFKKFGKSTGFAIFGMFITPIALAICAMSDAEYDS